MRSPREAEAARKKLVERFAAVSRRAGFGRTQSRRDLWAYHPQGQRRGFTFSIQAILLLVIAGSAVGLVATLVCKAGIDPSPRTAGAELVGTAHVIDGDTIEVVGTRIRLWGIDAPEHDQTCQGKRGETYRCGSDASAVLRELAGGQRVVCAPRDHDRYGRTVAVCRTESGELNATMVRRGWAVDYTRYSGGRYHSEQEQARRDQLGIWAGRFDMPEQWRHQR